VSADAAAPAPWIAAQRTQLLAQRGHAWLLHGPSGLGQFALALELVRAWLCESPAGDGAACGHCASCHAIDVHTHADLCVLMPETQMLALGWPLPEKAQAEIEDKKRKASREIRVEASPQAWALIPKAMARGDVSALSALEPAQAVDALQKLCHDLLAQRVGAQPRYFDAADLPRPPGLGPLTRWSRALIQEARTADHPFNAGLMLESLVAQARQTLNSRH